MELVVWKQRLTTLAVRNSLLRVRVHRNTSSSSSRLFFHVSSCIQKNVESNSDHDEETSKDWIPPQRPLSGDLGKSDEYAMIREKKKIISSSLTNNTLVASKEVNTEIIQTIQEDPNSNENIQFIDLDLEDWSNLDDKDTTTFTAGGENFLEDISDDDIEEDGFDIEAAFENDDFINEIMENLDEDDEETLDLQMQMIDQRIEELKEEYKKGKDATVAHLKIDNNEGSIHNDNSELDEFLKEQNLKNTDFRNVKSVSSGPDWLSTRRSRLSPTAMLTPEETSRARQIDGALPVVKNTLLSSNEIISCLTSLGAIDVSLVVPDQQTLPYLGWEGLIIATGSSFSHIRILANSVVDNLKKRDLAKKGVIGAMYGCEGGEDTTTSWKKRKGLPKKMDDGWIAVDCGNFIVHVQDDMTRKSIDLEGLWSPGERGRRGQELRNLDLTDEDAVEEYVANNPVPNEYTESLVADFWGDGQSRGGIGILGGKKSGRWTPSNNAKRKLKNKNYKGS